MLFAAALALATSVPDTLQILDVVPGSGSVKIEKGDVVTFGYRGWLYSTGAEFDSTKAKAPASFVVGENPVPRAWHEGLLGAQLGTRRVIIAPPAFAFGDASTATIPAKSTLGYEVDVLRIDKTGSNPTVEIVEVAPGKGDAVESGDQVSIHYTGTFLNGVKFDSSRDRNAPFKFPTGAGRVIKGFDLGVAGMRPGGKRKVTIPYSLGYGPAGVGSGVIPPYATLVFHLELLEVKKP